MAPEATHEETFLREIEAHPQRTDTRLVYADWLDEHGDARGAFLRHQIAMGSTKWRDEAFQHHQRQMRAIAADADRAWLHRLGYHDKRIKVDEAGLTGLLERFPLAVLRFWAPWSGPCRQMSGVIGELAEELAGCCLFVELNIDEQIETARQHGITSIPTMFLMRDGKVSERIVGMQAKANMLELIDKVATA